jgi:hypothetical protein
MTAFALFRADGELLVPQDIARSLWKADQMHGVATSGALARTVEKAVLAAGRDDLHPARFTVDLFRAPSMGPCLLESVVVRQSTRLMLVDATLSQDGDLRARASGLFLKTSQSPAGTAWSPTDVPSPPPPEIAEVSDAPRVPFFHSPQVGWSQNFADHQNDGRKVTWQSALPIVVGEEATPFQGLAGVADSTSMVCNWGTHGVEYINSDVTLAISRSPISQEVGIAALSRSEHDGIAVGTGLVFDRAGVIGTTTITSLANSRRAVDFTKYEFTDDGQSFSSGA